MRLLLIGTDRTVFSEGSAARERLARLSAETGPLDVLIFSTRKHGIRGPQKIAPGVHAHPTNSLSRLLYGWDALRITRHLSKPDVVSGQDPFETGLAALRIARRFRSKLAIEMHTDPFAPPFRRHSVLNRMRLLIVGFVLRRADGGYAVNRRVRDEAVRRYDLHRPFEVLPIYIDIPAYASLPRRPHPRFGTDLLWVGRMEKEKNPLLALKAFCAAYQTHRDIGLTFVGGGRQYDAVRAEAARLGISDRVEFVGQVADVAPYYAQADLLLVTSAYEGYGMVVIEALAAGVPVLSTDVGIAREAGAMIVDGDYVRSLDVWLSGPRAPGMLRLETYASREEYTKHLCRFYMQIAGHDA
jgi:glycosyltransferase involved in cell wall biosynthesis